MMRLFTIILIAGAIGLAQGITKNPALPTPVTAFVNVNVIPMDRERVLNDQTVIVRDGRIVEIGDASKIKVPAGALRLDGRGKYLLPGLADMHAHLFSDGEFPDSLAGDELMVMLANGVTTIRLMIGTPEHLALRERVAKGELTGPTIYAASPQLAGRAFGEPFNGYVVTTPEQGREAVRKAKAAGYDFIKLTFFISRPVYDAVIEAAKEVGLRVIGHVDPQVGLRRALEAKQQIEHLDSYFEAVLKDDAPLKASVSGVNVWRLQNWASLDYIDERKINEVAVATAKAGIFTCPTLTFLKLAFGTGQSDEEIRTRPDYQFIPPKLREEMTGPRQRFWSAPPSPARRQQFVGVRNRLVKAIHDAGGKVMAGSDAPEWFLLYGYTLHRELKSLVEAGLSPFAALAAATRNPAEFLNALDTFGTIERGKRADLVLLDANPLDDITNTEKRAGVMVRGRWLPQAELQKTLAGIAARFQQGFEQKK
jgi:imidazolonepropionase-like amidohydrolase